MPEIALGTLTAFANNKVLKLIFFGNYFYGICAVALAIEASMQRHFPLNGPLFYILLFTSTVLYYSKAYMVTEISTNITNIRSAWYATHRKAIFSSIILLLGIFLLTGVIVLLRHWQGIIELKIYEWFLLLVFPLVSVFYYGISHAGRSYNIRNIGWLKPFVIGFTWAGLVSVYPVLFYQLTHGAHYSADLSSMFLFVKNLMFISVLCIMFDIKDYEMDYNYQLKTFVVKLGPLRTIWFIIIPLCILGLASFLGFAHINGFSQPRVIINTIPFILIILVAFALQWERSILFYLAVIDGLMLIKAICGILGMTVE